MKLKYKILFFFLFFIFKLHAQFDGLYINEFSQSFGEYIEFVVVGNKTCDDSTADIRNWVFDDNCGWYGAGAGRGIAGGHLRFANVSNWAAVPYGSVILVCRGLPTGVTADLTDANHDYIYVLPIQTGESSSYIEVNTLVPVNGAGDPNFVYPNPSSTYAPAVDWSVIGLRDQGDAVIVVNPTTLGTAFFSLAYSDLPSGSSQTPTISLANVGSGDHAHLTDNQPRNLGSWVIGNSSTETPGQPNGGANTTWINGMRATAKPNASANAVPSAVCPGASVNVTSTVTPPGTYNYSWTGPNSFTSTNQNFTINNIQANQGGLYIVTISNAQGCSDTAQVLITVKPVPVPVISNDTTICPGGTAHLIVSGGVNYNWSNGLGTSPSVNVSPGSSTTYTVTVYNSQLCTATATVRVNVEPAPAVNITGNPGYCTGDSTLLDAGGGYSSYAWSTGAGSQTIYVKTSGIYTVTVTTTAGCTGTASVNVGVYPSPSVSISGNAPICNGQNLTLTAQPAATDYHWSTGSNSQTTVVNSSGIYSVTVTNALGCTASSQVTVTASPGPPVSITGQTRICHDSSTVLKVTNPFSSINWSTGATIDSVIVTGPGTYTVTITDANGCTNSASQAITQDPPLNVMVTGDITGCAGEVVTLTSSSYSSYHWSNGSTQQSTTVIIPNSISLTVTNAVGCTGRIDLSTFAFPPPTADFTGDTVICAGHPATVTVHPSNGSQGVTWSTGQTTETITITTPGTYRVTINDTNCPGVDSIVIHNGGTVNVNITGQTGFCPGGQTTLDAGSGYASYLWSNGGTGQTTVVNTTGPITVTVTNNLGCSATTSTTITQFQAPTATITGSTTLCNGQSTTLTVNTNGSQITWSTGEHTPSITVSTQGVVSVTVTNNNGCTSTASVSVIVGTQLTINISGDPDICQGETTTLDAGPGFASYAWNTGEGTQTLNVNSTSTHSVTVSDAGGCTGTASFTVTVRPNPNAQITGGTEICNGSSTVLDAGTGFQSYQWSTGAGSQTISVNQTGIYSVTVSNNFGCSAVSSVEVTSSGSISVNISGNTGLCPGGSTVLDAGPGYDSYHWSNNALVQTTSITTAGIYIVTVTNDAGCSGTASVEVTLNTPPTATITGTLRICNGNETVLTVNTNGTSYEWSTGSDDIQITVNQAGIYRVTVYDDNNCSSSSAITVVEGGDFVVTVTSDKNNVCAGETITLDAGAGYSSYSWSGGGSGQTLTVNATGTYIVTVTNAEGCTSSGSITVTVKAPITVVISGSTTFCTGGSTTLTVNQVFDKYEWSNGAQAQGITVSTGGPFSVTVTDAGGCTGSSSVVVTESDHLSVTITPEGNLCAGDSVVLDAGSGYTSYAWSYNGQTTQKITVTNPDTYTVTVTGSGGCTGEASFTVNQSNAPNVQISGEDAFCKGLFATLDADTGFKTYKWSTGESTQVIKAFTEGWYYVTVTNNNGCEGVDSVFVTETDFTPVNILKKPKNLCEDSSMVLSVFPAGFDTYQWTFNGNPIPGSPDTIIITEPGLYKVSVSVNGGCKGVDSINIQEFSSPKPTINDPGPICQGQLVVLDPGSGYQKYLWENGSTTPTKSVNKPGTYSVTVTDNNGCTGSVKIDVLESNKITVNITGGDKLCKGDSLLLGVDGDFDSYDWSNGKDTKSIYVTKPGKYSVTVVTDAGCQGNDTVDIAEIPSPTVHITGDDEICDNETTTFSVDPGLGDYKWSNSGTGNSITVSAPQKYYVTVTGANGCKAIDSILLKVNKSPTVQIAGSDTYCGNNPSTLDAGSGFVTYSWSNGDKTQTTKINTEGLIYVTVTDAKGCQGKDSIDMIQSDSLSPAITGTTGFCQGGQTILNVGSGYSDILWSDGSKNQTLTVTQPGTYTVKVTNEDGCSGSALVKVVQWPAPNVQVTGGTTICKGVAAVLTTNLENGDFKWSTGANTDSIVVTQPGNYTVTVTDNNGCTSSASASVTESENLAVTITGDGLICKEGTSQLKVNGTFTTYKWSTGSTDPEITADESGSYEVTVSNASGCTGTGSFDVDIISTIAAHNDTIYLDGKQKVVNANVIVNDQVRGGVVYQLKYSNIPSEFKLTDNGNGEVSLNFSTFAFTSKVVDYEICDPDCPDICATAQIVIIFRKEEDNGTNLVITPNGDGLNDVLKFKEMILDPDKYPNNSLVIVNRWGDIVYQASPYKSDWGGTDKSGHRLPEGTYYFMLRLDFSRGLTRVGNVTILNRDDK